MDGKSVLLGQTCDGHLLGMWTYYTAENGNNFKMFPLLMVPFAGTLLSVLVLKKEPLPGLLAPH
jgi:hypothetical protein